VTIRLSSSSDLNLDTFRRATWGGEEVQVEPVLAEQLEVWRAQFLDAVAQHPDTPVYGVNVGAGDGSSRFLDDDQRVSYATGLNSATSFGAALPDRVVRGIVFARLGSFTDGSAAVTAELAEHVAGMLSSSLPRVPQEATAGSGEILPLGHLFSGVPAALPLGPKESMALVNGAPCAAALTADIALRSRALLDVTQRVFALAVDALDAPSAHFDEALGGLWTASSEIATLRLMRDLLSSDRPRRTHQARVSVRILTRVLAAAQDAVVYAEQVADQSLAHPGDNPSFVPATPSAPARIVSNGGFHNHRAVVALDMVTRTTTDLVQLGQHLLHAIYLDPEVLPRQDNLALGISYMAAAGWSEDARLLAAPSILSFAAVGQNDVPNPLFAAWRKADGVQSCLVGQLSLLAAIASQSFVVTGRAPATALAPTLDFVRASFPPVEHRRDIGVDLDRLSAAVTQQLYHRCGGQPEPDSTPPAQHRSSLR